MITPYTSVESLGLVEVRSTYCLRRYEPFATRCLKTWPLWVGPDAPCPLQAPTMTTTNRHVKSVEIIGTTLLSMTRASADHSGTCCVQNWQ